MENLGMAIFCGIWYALSNMDLGYTVSEVLSQPVLIGTVLGIIMGKPAEGVALGAALELIYMGLIYPGGTVPEDCSSAALIALPIALKTGMSAEAAVMLAVPFGLLGTWVYNIKYTCNSFFLHKADKHAANGNLNGILRCTWLWPFLLTFALSFPLVFIANLVGPDAVATFMDALPEWVLHGIEVAGGLLPALGFAVAVYTIGKKELIPFFIIGYFMIIYFQTDVMAVAVFGTAIAFLWYYFSKEGKTGKKGA